MLFRSWKQLWMRREDLSRVDFDDEHDLEHREACRDVFDTFEVELLVPILYGVDLLGVIAVGVGGLEAESVMLGRASWMRLPDIVGVELTGKRQPGITATDIVLQLTEFLRSERVVGAYLEFFGEGARSLTLGDRATISNMTPEFGADRKSTRLNSSHSSVSRMPSSA